MLQDIDVVKNVKTHHFEIMLTYHITVRPQTFPTIIYFISRRIRPGSPAEPSICLDCQLFKNEAIAVKQAALSVVLKRHATAGVSLSRGVNETPTIQQRDWLSAEPFPLCPCSTLPCHGAAGPEGVEQLPGGLSH